jgi:hypothetical protein
VHSAENDVEEARDADRKAADDATAPLLPLDVAGASFEIVAPEQPSNPIATAQASATPPPYPVPIACPPCRPPS